MRNILEWKNAVLENVGKAVLGAEETTTLILTAVLTGGHILLEDVPGLGKTALAKAVSKSLGIDMTRVQFTPDLLPSDLIGIKFFNQKTGEFEFRRGPLFANLVLADEINRAAPRTQSSLLESMAEQQISVDGETHVLTEPYLVIATQNPVENTGTFPLPEAQMDRFLMRLSMGYPSRDAERAILKLHEGGEPVKRIEAVSDREEILSLKNTWQAVYVAPCVEDYLLTLVEKTRDNDDILLGLSPRATLALYHTAKAYAALQGRDYVKPDDIQYLWEKVCGHRIIVKGQGYTAENNAALELRKILESTPVPVESFERGE